jgi:PTS system mannose-specific IID component
MSGWVALLETDGVLVGQWLISRPLFVGPLLGLLCGKLAIGISLGILFELFTLDVSPVGAVMPLNGTVAAGTSVLLSAGPDTVPLALAFPVGLLLSVGHRRLESRLREWRGGFSMTALKTLNEDGAINWEGLILRSIGAQVIMTASFVYFSVFFFGPFLSLAWGEAPLFFRGGLEFGLRASAGIGLATLMYSLGRKV